MESTSIFKSWIGSSSSDNILNTSSTDWSTYNSLQKSSETIGFDSIVPNEIINVNESQGIFNSSTTPSTVTFPTLARYLDSMSLSGFLEEVIFHFTEHSTNEVKGWNVKELQEWISKVSFLQPNATIYSNAFAAEFIDGECFLELSDKEWTELCIDSTSAILLKAVRDGWRTGWGQKIIIPAGAAAGILSGIPPDVPHCSPKILDQLAEADLIATTTGQGAIYGQLVIIGYKEYRVQSQSTIRPMGINNEKFVLKRRRVANGIYRQKSFLKDSAQLGLTQTETTENSSSTHIISLNISNDRQICMEFVSDPSKDVFQLGRVAMACNDFIVRGPLHIDHDGVLSGPVSRYACRIECDRLPPYKCRIYAGGFNDKRAITVAESVPKWQRSSDETDWDSLTTFGIRVWRPDVMCWREISVLGHATDIRHKLTGESGEPVNTDASHMQQNELVDGTIVDLAGVSFIFQSPQTAERKLLKEPQQTIRRLNNLKPQCPVLMHTIRFVHVPPKERVKRAAHRMTTEGEGVQRTGTFHIPAVDYSDVDEDRRPYVFPSCGHVHAYSKALIGRPCPLCRSPGTFCPLIFPFEPAICHASPTHVFNPCGHAAAKETCEFWAAVPMPDLNPQNHQTKPLCPFCATNLHDTALGGPFNRLVLQFDGDVCLSDDLTIWQDDTVHEADLAGSEHLRAVDDEDVEEDDVEEDTLCLQQLKLRKSNELMSSDMDERKLVSAREPGEIRCARMPQREI